jgi:hypothetical protein
MEMAAKHMPFCIRPERRSKEPDLQQFNSIAIADAPGNRFRYNSIT